MTRTTEMNARALEQTILWRRMDLPGHDACGLWALDSGWRLTGTAVFCLDAQPCHLSYEVDCDTSWYTRSATVTGWIGRDAVKLVIVAVPGERWSLNGAEQTRVAGCIDVDLGFPPATNLIQLRRLALGVGDKADAPAAYLRLDNSDAPEAWFRFPELALERLEQQYRRVELNRYEYQSQSVGYAALLDVTDIGFVTRYPGLWGLETGDRLT